MLSRLNSALAVSPAWLGFTWGGGHLIREAVNFAYNRSGVVLMKWENFGHTRQESLVYLNLKLAILPLPRAFVCSLH